MPKSYVRPILEQVVKIVRKFLSSKECDDGDFVYVRRPRPCDRWQCIGVQVWSEPGENVQKSDKGIEREREVIAVFA